MSQSPSHVSTGVRGIFEWSGAYNTFQKWVGRDRAFTLFTDRYLKPKAGMEVLDIGCGTGTILDFLPTDVRYTGFDMNADYIQYARDKYGDRAKFKEARVGAKYPEFENRFELIFAYGLLHHLDQESSEALFSDAHSWLKPGGRFVTMDPVFLPDGSALAQWLISKDRGQNVRDPEGYQKLAASYFSSVDGQAVRKALRIPYNHYAMTCTRQ